MLIADDTRLEIEAILRRDFWLPEEYQAFLVKWLAFNRAYNDLDLGVSRDSEKVLAVGKELQRHWNEMSELATQLVSLECIGGKRVKDSNLLKPDKWVKSATLYLREQLGLLPHADPFVCQFAACRPEKQRLCNGVTPEPWDKGEMAALLRLVYQVRCNLVHGDKRLYSQSPQTGRDLELITVSTVILDRVLAIILQEDAFTNSGRV
jgi:hypothetical protein